jgi:serine/threonine protein kinase
MNEDDYQVLEGYVLFKEIGTDAIGVNYRAGEINTEERTIMRHHMITDVYPFLYSTPNAWKKVSILLEGVKKSNIPKLYSPDKIFREGDKHYLVYPFMKGKPLEQLLEDSTQKDNPINFDLAFSLAFAIADLIDIGSSIVVSGEKSFHGFLTPDNILIDYDGKIYLKNYGIYPYLSREEEIFTEMVKKYGAWIAPEFLRKEKPVCQSDIYHLGYIIYRILTGKYYSYSPEEDFDSKFSNISFSQHIPSGGKEFLTNIITFFKKTLHPTPAQRFANIKEFKDYISNNFHIEELSSVTFSLAYFMNSLYQEVIEEENKILPEELAYTLPEPEKEEEIIEGEEDTGTKGDDHLVEGILSGLEEQKKSRAKLFIPLITLIVIIIAASAFIIINQQKQAQKQREASMKSAEEMKRNMEQFKTDLESEYQKRLKEIEEKAATTVEEKAEQEDEIKKLREWQKEEMRKALEKQKQKEELIQQQKDEEQKKLKEQMEAQRKLEEQKRQEEEKKKKELEKQEETKKKLIEEEEKKKNLVKEGDLISVTELTEKPQKIKDRKPFFSSFQRRKYQGTERNVRAMILIDENGSVTEVRMIGNVPDDLKSAIEKALEKWKYTPPLKGNIKVKVWYPVDIGIRF